MGFYSPPLIQKILDEQETTKGHNVEKLICINGITDPKKYPNDSKFESFKLIIELSSTGNSFLQKIKEQGKLYLTFRLLNITLLDAETYTYFNICHELSTNLINLTEKSSNHKVVFTSVDNHFDDIIYLSVSYSLIEPVTSLGQREETHFFVYNKNKGWKEIEENTMPVFKKRTVRRRGIQ